MMNLLGSDVFNFLPSKPANPSPSGGYGPEWDVDNNTPGDNGGDNAWAGDPYGPEWDVDNNTPGDNGGNNPWAPGYDSGVWG